MLCQFKLGSQDTLGAQQDRVHRVHGGPVALVRRHATQVAK